MGVWREVDMHKSGVVALYVDEPQAIDVTYFLSSYQSAT